MVTNFREEYVRRDSNGESGSEADIVYDKLFELLREYPTIIPPFTYSSFSRKFTDVLHSSSMPVAGHRCHEAPQVSEPPTVSPPTN